MSELGQMLRDARESMGISLAEAEEATKIRRKYLQALEESDHAALPPSVYVRGFLRSYASFLGLDPERALAAYQDGAQGHAQPAEPRIISEPLTPSSRINWEVIAGVLMLLAVAIVLVLVYRLYVTPLATGSVGLPPAIMEILGRMPVDTPIPVVVDDNPTATPTTEPTPTPPPPTPMSSPTPAPPTPTATPTSRPTATATPQPARAQDLTLDLRVTARSWIRVAVDGETVFEDTVAPGDEHTWTARREIALRTGNAGGLIATINGRELGALGESGQVLDYLWQLSDAGRVIMSTPTP